MLYPQQATLEVSQPISTVHFPRLASRSPGQCGQVRAKILQIQTLPHKGWEHHILTHSHCWTGPANAVSSPTSNIGSQPANIYWPLPSPGLQEPWTMWNGEG